MYTYYLTAKSPAAFYRGSGNLGKMIRAAVQNHLHTIENNPECDKILDRWADIVGNGQVYLIFIGGVSSMNYCTFWSTLCIESKTPLELPELFTEGKPVRLNRLNQQYELSLWDATADYNKPLAEWEGLLQDNSVIVIKYKLHNGDQKGALPYFGANIYLCLDESGELTAAEETHLFG